MTSRRRPTTPRGREVAAGERPTIPEDYPHPHIGGITSYRLTDDDWHRLLTDPVYFEPWQKKLIELLQSRGNEPLHFSEIQKECHTEYGPAKIKTRMDRALKDVDNLRDRSKTGYYFRLEIVAPRSGYYAILKHGYFDPPASPKNDES